MAYKYPAQKYQSLGEGVSRQRRGMTGLRSQFEREQVLLQKRLKDFNRKRQFQDLLINNLSKLAMNIAQATKTPPSAQLDEELGVTQQEGEELARTRHAPDPNTKAGSGEFDDFASFREGAGTEASKYRQYLKR